MRTERRRRHRLCCVFRRAHENALASSSVLVSRASRVQRASKNDRRSHDAAVRQPLARAAHELRRDGSQRAGCERRVPAVAAHSRLEANGRRERTRRAQRVSAAEGGSVKFHNTHFLVRIRVRSQSRHDALLTLCSPCVQRLLVRATAHDDTLVHLLRRLAARRSRPPGGSARADDAEPRRISRCSPCTARYRRAIP